MRSDSKPTSLLLPAFWSIPQGSWRPWPSTLRLPLGERLRVVFFVLAPARDASSTVSANCSAGLGRPLLRARDLIAAYQEARRTSGQAVLASRRVTDPTAGRHREAWLPSSTFAVPAAIPARSPIRANVPGTGSVLLLLVLLLVSGRFPPRTSATSYVRSGQSTPVPAVCFADLFVGGP